MATGCALISPRQKTLSLNKHKTKRQMQLHDKTSNSAQGILKMVSEFFPVGIIGLGLASSTILLEIFLGDSLTTLSMFYLASNCGPKHMLIKKNWGSYTSKRDTSGEFHT